MRSKNAEKGMAKETTVRGSSLSMSTARGAVVARRLLCVTRELASRAE
jgi:hypothetical protein